jgi:hypothetical protein
MLRNCPSLNSRYLLWRTRPWVPRRDTVIQAKLHLKVGRNRKGPEVSIQVFLDFHLFLTLTPGNTYNFLSERVRPRRPTNAVLLSLCKTR